MHSNPKKCEELTFQKKRLYGRVGTGAYSIPRGRKMAVLGITFQDNDRFNTYHREKLIKTNKCLYAIRRFQSR